MHVSARRKHAVNLRIERVYAIEQGGGPRDGRFDEKVIGEKVSPEALVGALEGLHVVGARRKGEFPAFGAEASAVPGLW